MNKAQIERNNIGGRIANAAEPIRHHIGSGTLIAANIGDEVPAESLSQQLRDIDRNLSQVAELHFAILEKLRGPVPMSGDGAKSDHEPGIEELVYFAVEKAAALVSGAATINSRL